MRTAEGRARVSSSNSFASSSLVARACNRAAPDACLCLFPGVGVGLPLARRLRHLHPCLHRCPFSVRASISISIPSPTTSACCPAPDLRLVPHPRPTPPYPSRGRRPAFATATSASSSFAFATVAARHWRHMSTARTGSDAGALRQPIHSAWHKRGAEKTHTSSVCGDPHVGASEISNLVRAAAMDDSIGGFGSVTSFGGKSARLAQACGLKPGTESWQRACPVSQLFLGGHTRTSNE